MTKAPINKITGQLDEWQENICNIYQKKSLIFFRYKEILIINGQRDINPDRK